MSSRALSFCASVVKPTHAEPRRGRYGCAEQLQSHADPYFGEFFEAPNLIDPLTLKFGPRQANIWGSPHVRDVDGDGDEDLLVKFLIQQTGIACGDTSASLSGRTFDFQSISGSDAINTFNCPRTRKRH